MALSGVRSSWLMLARNADLVRDAASASALRRVRPHPGRRGFRASCRGTPPSARLMSPSSSGAGGRNRRREVAARDRQHAVGQLGQPGTHVAQHEQPDDQAGDHQARDRDQDQPEAARFDRLPRQRRRRVGFALGRLDQIGHLRAQVRADGAQVLLMVADASAAAEDKATATAAMPSSPLAKAIRASTGAQLRTLPGIEVAELFDGFQIVPEVLDVDVELVAQIEITDASCALTTRASSPVIWLMSARML